MTRFRVRLGGLRLGTRLLLAFGAVAALPLIVVPLVIRAVTDSFDKTFARELDDAASIVRAELDRQGLEVFNRTRTVATGPLVGEITGRIDEGDAASLITLAAPALAESGLDVLEVFDKDGRILLSGHLPARFGDTDEGARRLLDVKPGLPVIATVEVRHGDEIRPMQALVVAMQARLPDGGGVLGGKLFGDQQLARLSELVRGEVSWRKPGAALQEPTPQQTARRMLTRFFGQSRPIRDIGVQASEGERTLRIRVNDDALAQTKGRIALGALAAFLLALVVGGLLAALLARRTVAPVEALVAGTRELAKGDWSHRVDVKATGEIAQLVDAFNQMAGELSRAKERVAQAERIAAWEQIARALAHEIKNPLTPIAMAIETLQRTHERQHPQFDRFFKEGTATVLEEVARLKRLATEFGEFARWPKPVASPATPAELVRSAAALYTALPDGVQLQVEIDDALPQVQVDRDQMQRALVNLVKNALEAMTSGGRITLQARALEGGVAIEVADTGPGISPETADKLFQPYFTTKAEGTGLGLAIVHRIVSEHGGRLTVHDTPGGGATFRLWLPALAQTKGTTTAA